jgi:hypothetical protein
MSLRELTRVRLGSLFTAIAFAVALVAPPTAPAHPEDAASQHATEDSAIPDPATQMRLTQETVKRSAAPSAAAAAAVSGDPGQSGQWGPLENWPVVAIHAALLPNGQVLAHDAVGDKSYTAYTDHTYTRATVWNPTTDSFTPDWLTGFDIFCNGLAHLANGTMFFAGGNADPSSNGITATHTFDYLTNIWTRGADMRFPRWYPTVTAMPNGEMVITSGRPWIPEVRGTDGLLRTLSQQTATMDLPLYPWMDVAPDGRIFDSGPDDALRALDPAGGGAWQTFGPRGDGINRDYGSHAMYDIGKILVAGGGPSTNTARTIDINGGTPQVSTTSPMNFGRRQFGLTDLADGTVLATGGNSTGATYIDMNGGVYNAELWDPATGNWTVLAAESVTRQYHSTALLLPDGRVLSAGGGICNDCDAAGYLGKNAQIFSPPYLFKKDGSGQLAARPQISGAPDSVSNGASFQITTPDAASITKVGLIRLGAVTHENNMDQRYVPLSFSAGSGQLSATVPQNPNVTPPGYYMLFIVNDAGVPSVAKILWVGNTTPPPPPPAPEQPPAVTLDQPADGASFTAPATVNLSATPSDLGGSVAKVEFFKTVPGSMGSTVKLGEATTAPYTFSWTGVGAGTYAVTARVTDNQGVTSTTPGRTIITVNAATNQPPTVTLNQPANGATFTAPATVNLASTATDADGSVAKVEFLNGTTVVGTDTTAPYSFTWSGVAAGTYTLTARATDNVGATTTSAASTITVKPPAQNRPPTVSITSPTNCPCTYPFKPTINVTAAASDPDGRVTKVEFLDGTTVLATDTTTPYSYSWRNLSSGTHSLRARATDNAGAVTTSAPVSITVKKR